MGKDLLYVRIAKALEKQIKNKVLSSGDKLPSLRTIKEEYGVSMNTATQAFLELEKWDEESISERANQLCDKALEIWNIE